MNIQVRDLETTIMTIDKRRTLSDKRTLSLKAYLKSSLQVYLKKKLKLLLYDNLTSCELHYSLVRYLIDSSSR